MTNWVKRLPDPQPIDERHIEMKNIIISGYPGAANHEVKGLLCNRGMKEPRPSRAHNMTPYQICEAVSELTESQTGEKSGTRENAGRPPEDVLWRGILSDLVISNRDQSLWGWYDHRNIHILDDWIKVLPSASYIFLYREPANVLLELLPHSQWETDIPEVDSHLECWNAYNRKVLEFYNHHPDNCLLLNTDNLRYGANRFLQAARDKLSVPLNGRLVAELTNKNHLAYGFQGGREESGLLPSLLSNPMMLNIARSLIGDNSKARALFDDLESVADIPMLAHDSALKQPITLGEFSGALEQLSRFDRDTKALEEKLAHLAQEKEQILSKQEAMAANLNVLRKANEEIASEAKQRAIEISNKSEELTTLRNKIKTTEATHANELNALKSKNEQLSAELVELKEENSLLINQLHTVQKQYEEHYLSTTTYYGAAERVKRHLSYRLGSTMISHSRSLVGFLTLPLALVRTVRQYKKDKPSNGCKKLPPIHRYKDAYEAERVKRHLSYRLGQTMIDSCHSLTGWIKLPYRIYREVREFRNEHNIAA